jgi:hypothetical protein
MEDLIMKKFLLIMLLCVGLTGSAKADLVAGYGFDGDLSDGSNNGYDGIAVGTVAFSSDVPPGKSGQSLLLDGTNHVQVPINDVNPFDGTGDFTIVAWFKPTDPGVLISSARDTTPDNHSMAVYALPFDSEIVYDNFWVGAAWAVVPDPADDWHHVAVTYVALDETITMYIDGVFDAESFFNPEIPDIVQDTVLIGNSLNTEFPAEEGAEGWIGNLRDVGIFNHALTEQEILEVMDAAGFGPGGKVAQNPIPENGAILVEVDTDISWEANPDVNEPITFDVYFGTEPNELHPDWYGNTPLVAGTTARTVLNNDLGGPLEENTKFYWRVDTHDPNNGAPILWTGQEWSFTTRPITVVITTDPESVTAPAGSAVSLTVEAINAQVHQWYKVASLDPNEIPTAVTGGTDPTLTLDPLELADEGFYYCHITNAVPSEATSAPARVLTERMMAWYKLDGNAEDSSATGEYDGVVASGPDGTPDPTAAYVTGIDGMAVDLDGISQYVDVPHQIGPLTSATVSLWVNPDLETATFDYNSALFHDDEWTEGDIHALLFPDETEFVINGGVSLWTDNLVPIGEWLFLAYVYDATGEAPVQQLYINGELALEDESSILELQMGPLSIGGWWTIDADTQLPIMTRLMDAQFDDVRIYNYPISSLNIASMYADFADDSACSNFDIPLDLDGNCKVDINDFAVMALEWTVCGVVPDCLFELP